MPQAEIVADRLPVMTLVNAERNQARNAFRHSPDDLPEGVAPEVVQAGLKNRQ